MTTFTDNFNRANGAIGAGWVDADPTIPFLVADNSAYSTFGDGVAVVAVDDTFHSDQEASVTFTAVGVADRGGPAVRVDTAADTAYAVDVDGFNGADRRLIRIASGGVKTVIGTVNIAPVAGDRVTLRVVGSTLTVYVNGVLVDTVVDATLTTGAPGMYYQRSNTGVTRLDDFVGTDAFVKFDAVGSATAAYQSAAAVSPATWNHTSAAKALVLAWATGNGGNPATWAATCDGVPMVPIGVGPALGSRLFGLFVENAGTHLISITHDNIGATLNANSISYVGCDPATPYSAFTAGVSGTGTNPAVAVPSTDEQLIVDFLFSRAAIEGLNQTAVARATFTNGGAGQAIGEKRGVATSTQMGWTVQSSGDTSFDVALALNPAETDEYVVFDYANGTLIVNTSFIEWEHEVGANANILLVPLLGRTTGEGALDGTIAPTVDGVPLTHHHTELRAADATLHTLEVWYQLNPTPGTHTVRFDRGSNINMLAGASLSYSGVDEANPFGASEGHDFATNPGLTTHDIAAFSGDRLVDFFGQSWTGSTRDMAPTAPLTQRFEASPSPFENFPWLKVADVAAASTATTTATWSYVSGYVSGVQYGVVLRAARTHVVRGTWQTSTTDTVGIVIPDEPNRVVDAAFTIEVRGSAPTSITATCGGVPMLEVTGSPSQSPNGVARVHRFYLLDADLPAVGDQNVVFAFTGGSDYSWTSAAAVHSNVDQVAPVYAEGANDITDTLTIPDAGTWAYADGDLATAVVAGGDGSVTFAWPSPWDEQWDMLDGTGDAVSTGGTRSYYGSGTDSVIVTATAAQRVAGSVLIWSVAPVDWLPANYGQFVGSFDTAGTPVEHLFDAGDSANRVMYLHLTWDGTWNRAIGDTAVTFNGVTATPLGATDANNGLRTRLYRLVAPASGEHTISINPEAAGAVNGYILSVVVMDDVDQTTPEENYLASPQGSDFSSPFTSSHTIASEAGDTALVFHSARSNSSGVDPAPATPTGYTEWSEISDTSGPGIACSMGTAAGAATVPTTATWTNLILCSTTMGVSVRRASGGVGEILGTSAGVITITSGGEALVAIDGSGAGQISIAALGSGAVLVLGTDDSSITLVGAGSGQVGDVVVGDSNANINLAGAASGTISVSGESNQPVALVGTSAGVVAISGASVANISLLSSAVGSVLISSDGSGVLQIQSTGGASVLIGGISAGAISIDGAAVGIVSDPAEIVGASAGVISIAAGGVGRVEVTGAGAQQIRLEGAGTVFLDMSDVRDLPLTIEFDGVQSTIEFDEIKSTLEF